MTSNHVAPASELPAFNCPHCNTYAHQIWGNLIHGQFQSGYRTDDWVQDPRLIDNHSLAFCHRCELVSVWYDGQLVWPVATTTGPPPNSDIDDDIIEIYEEARAIAHRSPRGAAALLRLCLQMLCVQLDLPGKDLNADIGELVKQGLPARVQQALDVIRVIGNDAVHPGQIDINDDPDIVDQLFTLLNFIADDQITKPREIEAIYATLPDSKREQVERRDRPLEA